MRINKTNKAQVIKQSKGITLIALVITIIVLLILAGVSIATLVGENGILTQAQDAKKATTKAEAREKIQLEMLASIGTDGKYNVEKAIQNLEDNLGLTVESGNVVDNGDGTITVTENGYKFLVDTKGIVKNENTSGGNTSGGNTTVTFNPDTLTIGTATNTDKYGWKVKDYTVATTDCPSGVWRLFYQDSNYTYLINDELTKTYYKPSDYYETIKDEDGELKYETGADVSKIGQKLSPKISSLFTESNTNTNIRFTAWMTDPDVWKEYKDENGDAVFAIGSPTAELFAASYNNRSNKSNIIEFNKGTSGYTENTESNWLNKSDNYGIYNKDGSSRWWLASPCDDVSTTAWRVEESIGFFEIINVVSYSIPCRPTVCIPTAVFNSNYLDSVVAE